MQNNQKYMHYFAGNSQKLERGNSETWRYSSSLTHSPLTLPAQ